jgi:hypothetical protein
MERAAENKGDLKILAVTALTSLDRGDLDDLGLNQQRLFYLWQSTSPLTENIALSLTFPCQFYKR